MSFYWETISRAKRIVGLGGRAIVESYERETEREVSTVAIFDGEGNMLMGLRRDNKAWTTPGGHLEDGETPLEAAIREVWEESGIQLVPDEIMHVDSKIIHRGDEPDIKVNVFCAEIDPDTFDPKTHLDPDGEIAHWSWVSMENGCPEGILSNLHVHADGNLLMQSLALV